MSGCFSTPKRFGELSFIDTDVFPSRDVSSCGAGGDKLLFVGITETRVTGDNVENDASMR